MDSGLWIYDSHLGGLYTSDYPLSDDSLYCEQCGDWDSEIGFARNRTEARKMIKADNPYYTNAYIQEFSNENFPRKARDTK